MRYEVKLMNRNMTGENKTVLFTNNKDEAFFYVSEVKARGNNTHINEYDDVAVFDNGECLLKIRLF